jgi:proteic killer suppression protein
MKRDLQAALTLEPKKSPIDIRIVWRYTYYMIRSFAHKGLEKFYRTGSKVGIQAQHAVRLRLQLGMLDSAQAPEDMNYPGWQLHPLKGSLLDHWSVTINGNWRLTFRFEEQDAYLVDCQDYH